MTVKILSMTDEPLRVMYTAARTCYSKNTPSANFEAYTREKAEKLLSKVLASGHTSIMEHCNVTLSLEGVSRVLLAQLTRHRAGVVFSVQSQRYVEIKESIIELMELAQSEDTEAIKEMCDKYFIDFKGRQDTKLIRCLIEYRKAIANKMEPEDARMYLPNCTKTNIVMTCNIRQLAHMCNLRCCTRAQQEIRMLFNEIARVVSEQEPFFKKFLVPTCEINGFCTEEKCCGRKPKLDELVNKKGEKNV